MLLGRNGVQRWVLYSEFPSVQLNRDLKISCASLTGVAQWDGSSPADRKVSSSSPNGAISRAY